MHCVRLISLAAALVILVNPASGQDSWPQFRGIDSRGVASVTSLPVELAPDKCTWSVEIPRGVSSPCIFGDHIFLTAYDETQKELKTICLDRSSGKTRWTLVAPAKQIEEVHVTSSPANATPVADEERVYVYFGSLGLLCYDNAGKEIWQHPLPMPQGRFGTGTSPILVGDLVVLNHDLMLREDAGDSYLLAVNRLTGKEVWKAAHQATFTPYSTPFYWHEGIPGQIILYSSGRLTSYAANDGNQLWTLEDLPEHSVATPTWGEGFLFMSGTGMTGESGNAVSQPDFAELLKNHDKNADGLLAIEEVPESLLLIDRQMSENAGDSSIREFIGYVDSDKNENISQQEWEAFKKGADQFLSQAKQGVYAVSLNGGETQQVAWSDSTGIPEIPSPLYVEGRLYLVKNGGIVYCRDARTGKTLNRRRLQATGGYYASPVFGDDKIYVASDNGVVTVLEAGDKLNVLSTNDLGEPIAATPAIVDDTIYVRTDGHLFAFGKSGGK